MPLAPQEISITKHHDPLIRSLGGGFTYFLFSTPTWGNDPIWLIFFKWIETTNRDLITAGFFLAKNVASDFFLATLDSNP